MKIIVNVASNLIAYLKKSANTKARIIVNRTSTTAILNTLIE